MQQITSVLLIAEEGVVIYNSPGAAEGAGAPAYSPSPHGTAGAGRPPARPRRTRPRLERELELGRMHCSALCTASLRYRYRRALYRPVLA